jgi:hypothetical protein
MRSSGIAQTPKNIIGFLAIEHALHEKRVAAFFAARSKGDLAAMFGRR